MCPHRRTRPGTGRRCPCPPAFRSGQRAAGPRRIPAAGVPGTHLRSRRAWAGRSRICRRPAEGFSPGRPRVSCPAAVPARPSQIRWRSRSAASRSHAHCRHSSCWYRPLLCTRPRVPPDRALWLRYRCAMWWSCSWTGMRRRPQSPAPQWRSVCRPALRRPCSRCERDAALRPPAASRCCAMSCGRAARCAAPR